MSTTIHYPFCLRGFLNCYHNFFLCVRKMKKLLHLFCAALKFSLFEIWVNFCCIFFIIWPLCVFLTSSHQLYNLYWLFFNTIHIFMKMARFESPCQIFSLFLGAALVAIGVIFFLNVEATKRFGEKSSVNNR